MFARIGIYEIPADRRVDARASFQEAIAQIRESPGLERAYLLLGTESDRAVTITLWEDRDAMAASRVSASRLRSGAAAAVGGGIVSVDEFEVVSDGSGSS